MAERCGWAWRCSRAAHCAWAWRCSLAAHCAWAERCGQPPTHLAAFTSFLAARALTTAGAPMPQNLQSEEKPAVHAHRTAKVVELVASSTKSFDDAIRHGIDDAAATTRGITGCQVGNMSIRCDNGKVTEYRVDLRVAFGIERTPRA